MKETKVAMKTFSTPGRLPNQANVFNARKGTIGNGGKQYLFTHRNPITGAWYAEDLPITQHTPTGDKFTVYGGWVPTGRVVWQ